MIAGAMREPPRVAGRFSDMQAARVRRQTRRSTMGELKDKAKGLGNEVAGNVKQAAGDATDDSSLKAKGKAQEKKGEVQQAVGKVKGALGDSV